jgi:hypothetical protein
MEKIARIRHFRRLLPNVIFGSKGSGPKLMEAKILEQGPIKTLTKMTMKDRNMSKQEAQRNILDYLRLHGFSGETVLGTVAKFRGKRRAYINLDSIKLWKNKKGGADFRQVVMHEKFHTLPFVGRSEIGAHLYGGWAGTKGNVVKKLKGAAGQYGHLWKTRPNRTAFEHGALGAAAYGGYKGVKAIKDKLEKKANTEMNNYLVKGFYDELEKNGFALR